MILVCGASGQLGRLTVEHLRERISAAGMVALTRTPDKIADLGVPTRRADFDEPDLLVRAIAGADRLLLISTNDLGLDGRRSTRHANAVAAAVKAGVGHVVYTSVVHATDPENPSPLNGDHAATERALASSGLIHTVVRENVFAEILLRSAPAAVASGRLTDNIGEGATAYVSRDDVAVVAATLLAEGGHEGEVLDVTGPAAVTQTDVAAALTEVTGRRVEYRPLSDEEFLSTLVGQGLSTPVAQLYVTSYRAIREGWLSGVSDVVERVSGIRPTSVLDLLAANRPALLES